MKHINKSYQTIDSTNQKILVAKVLLFDIFMFKTQLIFV